MRDFIICFVVTCGLIAAIVYSFVMESSKTSFLELAETNLVRIEYSIDTFMDAGTRILTFLAKEPVVTNSRGRLTSYFGETADYVHKEYEQELEKEFTRLHNVNNEFAAIAVANNDGQYAQSVSDYPRPAGYDPRERSWYKEAMADKNEVTITSPYETSEGYGPMCSLVAKTYEPNGDPLGVVLIGYDMQNLIGDLESTRILKTGYILIFDKNGRIFADGMHPHHVGLTPEEFEEGHALIWDSPDGVIEYTSDIDKGKYIVSRTMKNTGWKIAVMFDKEEVTEQPRSILYMILLPSFSILVVAVFVLIIIARDVVRPIDSLIDAANIICGNDYETDETKKRLLQDKLNVSGSTESRRLAKSLRQMIQTLREQISEARRANLAKSEFLARMSHEIRTPMNAVLGMSELILREDTSDTVREHAESVKQAGTNLLAIINDILDLSKIESGKMEVVCVNYELSSLMNDVISIARTRLVESPIRFIVNIDSTLPSKLFGDEVRVRQILLNLLSNAIKYTQEGYVKIFVSGERQEDDKIRFSFTISDTGTGIRAEDMDKLFDRFSQFDKKKNYNVTGTGLGLAITQKLAQLMDGDVSATSVYGDGSVFTAIIIQSYTSEEPVTIVEDAENKNVLLYENQRAHSESISWSLWNLGVPYKLVETKYEFKSIIQKESFKFVFTPLKLLDETLELLDENEVLPIVVLLAEYGETAAKHDLRVVSTPVHTISIANILNGKNDAGYSKRTEAAWRYTAPTARILLVDDIKTNLKVASGLLSPLGAIVDTCLSGRHALRLVQENDYDIVFMDHMMPVMDGIEATAAIRDLEGVKYQNLVIIALTANAISGMKEKFIKNGFTDFISKPIEPKKLFGMIDLFIPKEKRVYGVVPEIRTADFSAALRIEGMDTIRAMRNLGSSLDEYTDVLETFCQDARERLSLLEKIPRTPKALNEFTTSVHALKSASHAIGASEFSESARELELAGINADSQKIADGLAPFRESLLCLLSKIEEALPKKPENAGAGTIDRESLRTLKKAFETKNLKDAYELLETLEHNMYDKVTTDALQSVTNALLMYDFPNALAALDSIEEVI
ncbi:hypothetical protein AGMMS49975_23310 [Clostridia bacterium]|nr:hypothetical protein AGMMS49975_23310 [Clostridia bacterium]